MRASWKHVGILGGTFDPIHRGHIAMAKAALDGRGLDAVLLVPSGVAPHKESVLASGEHRLEMARLAALDDPRLESSPLEVCRAGVSYTVDTLTELSELHGDAALYFIVGEDSLPELPRWRQAARILELAELLVAPRPDGSPRHLRAEDFPGVPIETLERCNRNRLAMTPVPVASREIRRRIAAGEPFEEFVPARVAEYIRRHGLYGYRGDRGTPVRDAQC